MGMNSELGLDKDGPGPSTGPSTYAFTSNSFASGTHAGRGDAGAG